MNTEQLSEFLSELEIFSLGLKELSQTEHELSQKELESIEIINENLLNYFGYCTTQHIWAYLFDKSSNKFESFEELSEFLLDPCSPYLSDVPCDLEKLRKNFPKIGMIKCFTKFIRKNG